MRKLKEQTANSVGAEAGSEPTVPDNKFRFSFDSPYDILALDTARHIGTFLKVDYDKIKIEDFYEGMQIESKKFKNKPKTIGDWVVVAKIAFKNLYKNSSYYDTANESLRLSIRKIIGDLLRESKGSKMKKTELRKIIREQIENIFEDVKDDMSIKDIIRKASGDELAMVKLATTMANRIKDGLKAVRRAEAAEKLIGKGAVEKVFQDRAKQLGIDTRMIRRRMRAFKF